MNTACTQQEEPPRQPLRKLTGFFRRQWILIFTLTAIFTAGALLVAYFLNDRYVASTLLLIDKAEAQLSNSKVNVLPSVGTEIEIMRSDAIYWKVAIELGYADNAKPISNRIGGASKPPDDTPQTASTSETAPLPVPSQKLLADSSSPIVDSNIKVPSHVIRELKKKIKIRQRGESEVIAVEAKADTPQEAAMLSRVFTKVYLAEHVRSKRKFIEEVEQALEDRVASLRKQDKNSNSNIDTAVRNFSSQYIARYKLVELNRHAVLPHIRVASWAVEPDRASFPQRKLIAIAGVLAAIQAAIAIALIVDLNFTGVSSLRELELASGVWNIGLIPGAGLKRTQRKKYQDWVIDLPSSPFSRSIQKLYHGIDLLLQQRRLPTSVMVTSMNKKLRHDVIAVALARSAALSGKKAVIVSGEMQDSQLPLLMSMEQRKTFTDVSEETLQQIVIKNLQTDPKTGLKLLNAKLGGFGWNDGIIQYSAFTNMLKYLERNFDLVVVVAPCLQQTDNVFLQAVRTGLKLLVVQGGASMPDDVTKAVQQLRRVGGDNVVTALIPH